MPIGRPNCSRVCAYGMRRVERRLGEPDGERPDADPPAVEDREERLEAAPPLAEQVRGRDAGAVEDAARPVAEACSPSLSSSRPTLNPGVSAGTMNALISGLPSSRVPVRAVTM